VIASRFEGNRALDEGGAIALDSGSSIRVSDSVFFNNEAQTGGAIALSDSIGNARCADRTCALVIEIADSEFEANSASIGGGALALRVEAGTDIDDIRLDNLLMVDNVANQSCDISFLDARDRERPAAVIDGSAFFGDCSAARIRVENGRLAIRDSSLIHDGTALSAAGPVELTGTVLTESSLTTAAKADTTKTACDSAAGLITSFGFNVSSDGSCALDQPSDQGGIDPGVARSGKDLSLLPGSPLIDAAPAALLALLNGGGQGLPCGYKDATGLGRPQDGDGDGGYECDIGDAEFKNGPDVTTATSSAYFDPQRNGEGIFVEILDGGLAFLAMFTYRADGSGPAWLVGLGQSVGNTVVVDEMAVTSGGVFGEGFDADAIVRSPVGGLSLRGEPRAGRIDHRLNQPAGQEESGKLAFQSRLGSPFPDVLTDMARLTNIVSCGTPPAQAPASGRSGSFFDPARSGEGIFVQWLEDGRVVVIWYTYDSEGNQFWTISDAERTTVNGDRVEAIMVYPAGSSTFGPGFDASEVDLEDWGTLTLDYDGCDSLTLDYASAVDGFGSGSYQYSRLTALAIAPCDLD